jgi:hypothetical protein
MLLFLRNLFRFLGASERRAQVRARLKAEALAAKELGREARGQNYMLEHMLRQTEEAERQAGRGCEEP